jgi:hypothetical protein
VHEAKPAGVDPAQGFVAATAATAVGDPAAPSDTTP